MLDRGDIREFEGTARFQVLRCLGAGGMGVVYEAVDHQHSCRVALKTLRSASGETLLQLKNEFRALQNLRHPNLVSLGELVEDRGRWFFTMELVEGVAFIEYVRPGSPADEDATGNAATDDPPKRPISPPSSGTLEVERLRATLLQLAQGLSVLHAAGMVHRDIKPSNLLVTRQGRLVILDFGLAKDLSGSQQTTDRQAVGTVEYMAPEQAAAKRVGSESDWYAVGVVLYESLTGRPPFVGAPLEVMMQKQARQPCPPREMVAEVPADLERLCLDLLQPEPADRPGGAEVLSRLGATEPTDRPRREASPARAPFVGRRAELDLLADAFAATRRGLPVTVLVEGKAGVGKTALVRCFAGQCEADGRGVVVLSGGCFEREAVPYNAIDGVVDALSQYLMRLPAGGAAALLPRSASLLCQAFPVLQRCRAMAATPRRQSEARIDPQERRTRVFAALREIFGRLADRHPLLLTIDDLNRADHDSMALLGEVLRPPDAPPLLLVATLRGDAGDPAGRSWQAGSLPGEVRRLQLGLLPPEETRALAAALLRDVTTEDPPDAETISAEAVGNPLFIEELVRHAAKRQQRPAPLRLDDVVLAHVATLPPAARRLIDLLSTAGRPISRQVLTRAADLEPPDAARAMDRLREANLVHSTGVRGEDAVGVGHLKVAEIIRERLTPEARLACHRELALALEAFSGHPADPVFLGIHWREAGEPARAAGHFLQAAQGAVGVLAFDRAAELFRAALALDPDPVNSRELLVRIAGALANAGRGAEAGQMFDQAVPGAPPHEALELRRQAAEQYLRSGHVVEGLTRVDEVLAAVGLRLPRTPRRALASLLFRRAAVRLRGLGFRRRGVAEVPPRHLTRIDACWALASTLATVDTIRGSDFGSRILLMALRAGEPLRLTRALGMEVVYASLPGPRARRRVERLLALMRGLARELQRPEAFAWVDAAQGVSSYFNGRFARAAEELARAEALFRDCAGGSWEVDSVLIFALFAQVYLGGIGEVARRIPQLLGEARDRGDLYLASYLGLSVMNTAWLASDDPEEVRRFLEKANQDWSPAASGVYHYYRLIAEGQLALYAGDCVEAHRGVAAGWEALNRSMLLRGVQVARVEGFHLRARCAVAAARRCPEKREPLLEEAIRAARRVEREKTPWGDALALLIRAAIAGCRGDRQLAARQLEHAAQRLEEAEVRLYAAAARRQLGRLVGGAAGAALLSAADDWMTNERIQNPARMANMLVPGLFPPEQ